VAARGVDDHRTASVRRVQPPRPVPCQRVKGAGRTPVGGPVHGDRRTARPEHEDCRTVAGVHREDVGNHAAARAGREGPEASHLALWARDPREQLAVAEEGSQSGSGRPRNIDRALRTPAIPRSTCATTCSGWPDSNRRQAHRQATSLTHPGRTCPITKDSGQFLIEVDDAHPCKGHSHVIVRGLFVHDALRLAVDHDVTP